MKKQTVNKSIMALVLATSAAATATPSAQIAGVNQVKTDTLKDASTLYKLAVPARYNNDKKGFIEGSIYLRLYKSKLKPRDLNLVTAEYEGYFYFEGKDNTVVLGGEDGNIILDLANVPTHNEIYLPKVYNMHGCNSTMTSCDPMAMQFKVFKDGTIHLQGNFTNDIEVNVNGTWFNKIYNGLLEKQDEK
jgi:hypothetical protein